MYFFRKYLTRAFFSKRPHSCQNQTSYNRVRRGHLLVAQTPVLIKQRPDLVQELLDHVELPLEERVVVVPVLGHLVLEVLPDHPLHGGGRHQVERGHLPQLGGDLDLFDQGGYHQS